MDNIVPPEKLNYNHIKSLIGDGKISGYATQKTGGMHLTIGHDENGFYTANHLGKKMRFHGDYQKEASDRLGEDYNDFDHKHFDHFHRDLMGNPAVRSYLEAHQNQYKGDSKLQGHAYYRNHGTPDKIGGIRIGDIVQHPDKLGSTGMFILHSKHPDNATHEPELIKSFNDGKINFDHDIVANSFKHIPAKDLKTKLESIDPQKLNSKNSDAKQNEQNKVSHLASEVGNRIKEFSTDTLPPKFGGEPIGHDFHPVK